MSDASQNTELTFLSGADLESGAELPGAEAERDSGPSGPWCGYVCSASWWGFSFLPVSKVSTPPQSCRSLVLGPGLNRLFPFHLFLSPNRLQGRSLSSPASGSHCGLQDITSPSGPLIFLLSIVSSLRIQLAFL